MKKQVFYIHGGNAYSKYADFIADLGTKPIRNLPGSERGQRWTDTLAEDLGEEFELFAPSMPNKENAKYAEWKIWFERHFEYFGGEVILLGWSQGAYFLVKYLLEEQPPFTVSALYLVAAPFAPDDFGGEDGGDFAFDTNRVGELAGKVGSITLFHSTDDSVVPYEHAKRYTAALPSAKLVTFSDRNHFMVAEFPELVALIKGG